jgi:hypothetical protein
MSVPPQTPYGSNEPGGYLPPATQPGASTNAIVALVLGILSLICCGCIAGIAGIIVGKGELAAINEGRSPEAGRGMAQIGMILSIIGTVLSVLGAIGYAVMIALAVASGGPR